MNAAPLAGAPPEGLPLIGLPLVGVSACSKTDGALPCQTVGLKYIEALADGSSVLPLLIPALGARLDPVSLVAQLDGIFLTGSPSNVDPGRYDRARAFPADLLDPARDATTFALIAAALAGGVPLLAVCRGFQELNVALGGTLHQKVQDLPGMLDHRADDDDPVDQQYAPVHSVQLAPDGMLASLLGGVRSIEVNSLHSQGIDRLAPRLVVEATAPDGLVEAVRVRDAAAFTLAVQWHPEWRVTQNPTALPIFDAFGAACRARQARRLQASR